MRAIAKERGLILGRKAAAAILELRARRRQLSARHVPAGDTAGLVRHHGAGGEFHCGPWTPWVMASAAQFRPAPPPALTSAAWTRDFNEIRELGALDSKPRAPPSKLPSAKFWLRHRRRTWNPMVAQVAAHRPWICSTARACSRSPRMAGMDAYIAVFEAKYHYNFWRPVTAVRNADTTGNPATPRDAGWLPLGETPMHPEYPCAHCITAAAVAAVLRGVVGDDIGNCR